MTTGQILLALLTGLAATELSEVCPWAARKLVRWSAHRRYAPPSRAELRAEELAAYIDDRPGRLFKLITASGFAAVAVLTGKVAPTIAPPDILWHPTRPTVPLHYEYSGRNPVARHPNTVAMDKAWHQLIDDVRDMAKEVGVASRSWRRCIEKLWRITGDDRWLGIMRSVDLLKEINDLRTKSKSTGCDYSNGLDSPYIISEYYFPTGSTVTRYQDAVKTTRAEIRRLAGDFLLRSAPR